MDPGTASASRTRAPRRPYSVLLPVGFAVPPALLQPRCALTAPFHPYPPSPEGYGGRSVLCGTFPRLAPAGRYPAPYVHGARTFLPRPPFGIGRAAVRPTDKQAMGSERHKVKGRPAGAAAHAAPHQPGWIEVE